MSHHVETFFDDDGKWGWQCFDPECRQEATGFTDIDSAQIAGDGHPYTRDEAGNMPGICPDCLLRYHGNSPCVRAV
jgi:hypothetical protein